MSPLPLRRGRAESCTSIADCAELHRRIEKATHRPMQDSAYTQPLQFIRAARRAILPLNMGGPCYWYSLPEFSNSTEPLRCDTFSGAHVTAIHVNEVLRESQASLCL
jgi:hypothetical protein